MEEGEAIMQAVFDRDRITVSVTMFGGGVLVTRTFEGDGMYGRFVDFMREQFGAENPIRASIAVGRSDKNHKEQ
jgi:hypothetical protein